MDIQRCPECGGRITTNYCDVCMKRVPFRGVSKQMYKEPWESSSAHREEKDHTCVSFGISKPRPVKTVTFPKKKKAARNPSPKKASAIAIVVAVLSLLPAFFGFVEDAVDSVKAPAPEPDYNYEAFVTGDVPRITPTELYNDGEICVTADTAGVYYGDYTVQFTIQNESDRDVTVSTQLLSVNGYMTDFGCYTPVRSGGNQQVLLQLYSYELEQMGITEIAEIAFSLDLYDSKTYETIAITELLTLKTDIAENFRQPIDDNGWEMHIDDHLRMVYKGATLSDYGDCDLYLYMENLAEGNVSVTIDTVRVNGEDVEGFLWETLRPGTRAVDSIYFYGLENLDITQFSQITDVYLEYTIDTYRGDQIAETVYCTVSFNPNALPVSE